MNDALRSWGVTIAAQDLREALDYDPATGVFRWRPGPRRRRVGQIAGGVNTRLGYRQICIAGRCLYAHRLAWLHMTGEWPIGELDHINGDREDNRWANLRPATRSENEQNISRARSDSRSGLRGVVARGRRWTAQIELDGKRRHLGTFDTAEEASGAYRAAKQELHPFWHEVA